MKKHTAKRVFQLAVLALLCAAIVNRSCRVAKPPGLRAAVIEWDQAQEHIGDIMSVEGPVVDTHHSDRSRGEPTFLNLGRAFPDEKRFTVVIWGEDRGNFPRPPEQVYKGRRIRVTGRIVQYEGRAQIELSTPDDIEVIQ